MNYFDSGVIHYQNKKYNEAKNCFETFITSVEPNNLVAHHNLGLTLIQLGLDEESLKYFELPCQHQYVESFLSKGAALRNLGRYHEALRCFGQAFIIDSNNAKAYSNYSNTLREFGQNELALDFIKIANRLSPDNTSLLNESITYFALGDFIKGYEKWDYRWYYETGESLKPKLSGVEFDGTQSVENKVVFVYCEQGFGDCIQFVRYVNCLVNDKATVILYSKPQLYKLFTKNFSNILVVNWGDQVPTYDYHVALLDLPKCYKTTINTIPYITAYLNVDEQEKIKWKGLLGPKTKPRIGITWSSNGVAYNTKFRRLDLSELVSIFSDDYQFINLQYDTTDNEKELLSQYNVKNFEKNIGDFYNTSGLITQLDFVISVDTAIAHLSGALGITTYVMLPNYGCDWRWFSNRTDSPFYSNMKLFRKVSDTYDSVFHDIIAHVKYHT